MKKQLFLTLVLLCAGISLNAMSTDMETKKEETVVPATPVVPAPVKEEVTPVVPAPAQEAEAADEDFEIDMESDVEEVE